MKFKNILSFVVALSAGTTLMNAESDNPELIEGKLPAYTVEARGDGIEGTIVVEALVDENGRVFAADVVTSIDEDLDAITLAAIQDWTFKPATVDGKPVMKTVRIPINFNLINPLEETILRAHDRAIASR